MAYLQKLCSADKYLFSYLCYLYPNLEADCVPLWINLPFLSRGSPLKCATFTALDWEVDKLSLAHRSQSSAATQPPNPLFFVPFMTVGILPSALQRNYRGWKEQKGQWRKLGLDGEEPLRPAVWWGGPRGAKENRDWVRKDPMARGLAAQLPHWHQALQSSICGIEDYSPYFWRPDFLFQGWGVQETGFWGDSGTPCGGNSHPAMRSRWMTSTSALGCRDDMNIGGPQNPQGCVTLQIYFYTYTLSRVGSRERGGGRGAV